MLHVMIQKEVENVGKNVMFKVSNSSMYVSLPLILLTTVMTVDYNIVCLLF